MPVLDRLRNLPFICAGSAMRKILDEAGRLAKSHHTVFILGEAGTGKSKLARIIREAGPWAEEAFVVWSAQSGVILESDRIEASTHWDRALGRPGARSALGLGLDQVFLGLGEGLLVLEDMDRLTRRDQGILKSYLDGVGVMDAHYQEVDVSVRIIATSQRRLEPLAAEGILEASLPYQTGIVLRVPPLRHRPEDVKPLAEAFVRIASQESERLGVRLTPAASDFLARQTWAGNVRELWSVVRSAVELASDGDAIDARRMEEVLGKGSPYDG